MFSMSVFLNYRSVRLSVEIKPTTCGGIVHGPCFHFADQVCLLAGRGQANGQDLRLPSPGQELEGLQLSTWPRVAPFALLLASDSEKHPRPWTQ